ncbi:hypothetical protein AC579_7366 [Pseudocercospora musae]|uniref:PITH domain-containing protein n=1 Tax=Pseudocercospora musae TaxID=113226 RepID=A0A139ICQ1_9PEZI|nr:hypothetical protein AC579_7366 [Pseudocercospora musae]
MTIERQPRQPKAVDAGTQTESLSGHIGVCFCGLSNILSAVVRISEAVGLTREWSSRLVMIQGQVCPIQIVIRAASNHARVPVPRVWFATLKTNQPTSQISSGSIKSTIMSHCHDEHSHHGHDHSEGASHDHTDDLTPALQNHIYSQIDFSAVNTLNESTPHSGSSIVQKTWTDRLSPTPELVSDADEQLLMHVPFTAQIRLHSILIRTSTTDSAPLTLKVYVNREGLDFSTASDLEPTQKLELSQTNDVQEVPVKRALFNSVRSLDLFFEENWGRGQEDETRIIYLGFKGEWMKLSREPVNFLYEAAPNPSDNKLASGVNNAMGSHIGGAGGRDGM